MFYKGLIYSNVSAEITFSVSLLIKKVLKVADRGSQEYNKLFGGFLSRNLDIKKSIFPEEEDYRKFR